MMESTLQQQVFCTNQPQLLQFQLVEATKQMQSIVTGWHQIGSTALLFNAKLSDGNNAVNCNTKFRLLQNQQNNHCFIASTIDCYWMATNQKNRLGEQSSVTGWQQQIVICDVVWISKKVGYNQLLLDGNNTNRLLNCLIL
jgi:hypothetical protein